MNRKERRKWAKIVSESRFQEDPQVRRIFQKISRNDQCPCGSGLKFKKCSCYDEGDLYYDPKDKSPVRNVKVQGGDKTSPALP